MYDWIYWSLLLIFIPLSVGTTTVGIYQSWVEYRSRSQALDVMRVYAERGDEPPASVTAALVAVGSGGKSGSFSAGSSNTVPPYPASRPTRARHMAHVAANIVFVLGFAGIAWWRMPDQGPPGALVMWSVVAAIFFAAGTAARLVGVFTTPSGRSRDER
jgi:hypothetical protein